MVLNKDMERYKKHFKEESAYVNDFLNYCKSQNVSKPTLVDLDNFVACRKITDFSVIREITKEIFIKG
jgi:hypothetical protein